MDERESDPPEEHDAVLDSDNNEGDGDSLFGGQDDTMTEGPTEAEGDSVDASGDSDVDADGEADLFDEPSAVPDASPEVVAAPSPVPAKPLGGLSLSLPGQRAEDDKPALPAAPAKKEAHKLPKPMFGSMSLPWQSDADLSQFSPDILLTSTLSGQVLLWDRRVESKGKHGVRALGLPPNTPPWCTSVCWNHAGNKIYVGRRNETVDEWDVRMLPDLAHAGQSPRADSAGQAPRYMRSLRMPRGSGPVSSVAMMPNDRHIVCGSFDNIRLWDTHTDAGADTPFKIVAGHHGGTLSHILTDARAQLLLTSSGDRGWSSSSTDTVLMHEIMAL